MEIKKLNGYDDYEFNNEGQYRISGGQWLSGSQTNKSKKRYCTLRNGKEWGRFPLDMLIYSAFKNKGDINKETIYHIDKDEDNNNIDNLQIEQIEETPIKKRGQVLRSYNKETDEKMYFKNMNQASKYFKCSPANLHYILGKNGGDLYGCISFKYVDKKIGMQIQEGEERKRKHKTEEARKQAIKESVKRSLEKKKLREKQLKDEKNSNNSILKYFPQNSEESE